MIKQPAVYILTNKPQGVLYIGVTSHLVQRIWQHRNCLTSGFTQKYNTHRLAFYELHGDMYSAINREKQLKKWNRQWKINLIERENPQWNDLWLSINH